MKRCVTTVVALSLLVAGCMRGDVAAPEGTTPASSSPETVRPLIEALPAEPCGGLREPPPEGEITFVAGGRLYAAAHDGGVRCMVDSWDEGQARWGPQGDRVLARGLEALFADGSRHRLSDAEVVSTSWSQPTGRAVVYVTTDGRLMKIDSGGGHPADISFLREHEEVIYHPAGTHIVAIGTHESGTYGIWLATNVGENPSLIAEGETAERIYSLSYAPHAEYLYFLADHGDRFDVHHIVRERTLHTDAELPSAAAPTRVLGGPNVGDVAIQSGQCPGSTEVRRRPGPTESYPFESVGWLSDRTLVLVDRPDCGATGDVYVQPLDREPELLVRNVGAVAVRTVAPDPPDPPRPADTGEA